MPAELLTVRDARPAEYAAAGELTVTVYVGEGLVPARSSYVEVLGDAAARAREADLLVAVAGNADDTNEPGQVVGTVTFCLAGTPYANLAEDGEAEFRMLAVDPEARGRGVGEALVRECLRRAVDHRASRLVLSTQENMRPAHRLYEQMGFSRAPERDWEAAPGVRLLAYTMPVAAAWCDQCGERVGEGTHGPCAARRELEPPRYCAACRRRMTVQVTPRGWSARCSEHGERRSR